MRVLLINPPTLDLLPNKEYIPPSSLLYLAGVLQRDSIEVKILDLNIYKPWEKDTDKEQFCEEVILQHIAEFRPGLIGFGCLFSGQWLLPKDKCGRPPAGRYRRGIHFPKQTDKLPHCPMQASLPANLKPGRTP